MTHIAYLPGRGVVEVAGEDRVGFLQGLVSNDVEQVQPGRAVWAALLSPQGKYLADFFILADGDRLLLDCGVGQAGLVAGRLARFRLRVRASVADVSDQWLVHAAWGEAPLVEGAVVAPDPRVAEAGWRVLSRVPIAAMAAEAWEAHRLALGLPEGAADLEAEKSVLLEAGFDELNGISWSKGCYMGQELTARTRYRGLLKRRVLPVEVAGMLPEPGTPVFAGGREVGVMGGGMANLAMATLRLDAVDEALTCDGTSLAVRWPAWLNRPALPNQPVAEGVAGASAKEDG